MSNRKAKRSSTHREPRQVSRNTQTTLRLPQKLYEQAKMLVQQQKNRSVNDFIVSAVSAYVRALERRAIDDAFRGMADDKQYQREALRLAQHFAASDAEALELSERDLAGA